MEGRLRQPRIETATRIEKPGRARSALAPRRRRMRLGRRPPISISESDSSEGQPRSRKVAPAAESAPSQHQGTGGGESEESSEGFAMGSCTNDEDSDGEMGQEGHRAISVTPPKANEEVEAARLRISALMAERQNQVQRRYGGAAAAAPARVRSRLGRGRAPALGYEAELDVSLSRPPYCLESFWSGDEALMRSLTLFSGERRSYRAAPLSTSNCPDLAAYYQLKSSSAANQSSSSAFNQLRTTAGQLARLAAAVGAADIRQMSNKGALWNLLEDRQLIQLFLASISAEMEATTSRSKGVQVAQLLEVAMAERRATGELQGDGRLQLSKLLVTAHMSSMKRIAAPAQRRAQIPEVRSAAAEEVSTRDLGDAQDFVVSKLDGIYSTIMSAARGSDPRAAARELFVDSSSGRTNDLALKWALNFTVAIVLFSGGQRTQAHAALLAEISCVRDGQKLSANSDGPALRRVLSCAREDDIFYMSLSVEKRCRSGRVPFVAMEGRMLDYVAFHVVHARSIFMDAATELARPHDALLVHTRSGAPLSSSSIRTSLHLFFQRFRPEMAHITPSILRRAHASNAMSLHRAGLTHCDLTEAQFAEVVAEGMNTSAREVLSTYAAAQDGSAVAEDIAGLHRAMR